MRFFWFFTALVSAYAVALLYFPAMRRQKKVRCAVFVALSIPIGFSPLVIAEEARVLRFFMAVPAFFFMAKLFDLYNTPESKLPKRFMTFAKFIANPFTIVYRRLNAEPQPSSRENIILMARSAVMAVVFGAAFIGLFYVEWEGIPFFVEHCAKALGFYLMFIPVTDVGITAWWLAGRRGRSYMDRPLLAITPSDFWRRFNRVVQQFMHEDVFRKTGGFGLRSGRYWPPSPSLPFSTSTSFRWPLSGWSCTRRLSFCFRGALWRSPCG